MSTAIATMEPEAVLADGLVVQVRSAAELDERWTPERIKTVWKMAAPKAKTVQVLAAFLSVAKRYDLDPLVGEVWLIESDGAPKVCTGRDTFVKVACREPGYEGILSGVVREGDDFKVTRAGHGLDATVSVEHSMGVKRGGIISGYCVAYRKGRVPVVIVRNWSDYKHLQNKNNWLRYGDDMIETRCIVAALRRQFPLAGLYIESEFAEEGSEAGDAPEAPGKGMAALRAKLVPEEKPAADLPDFDLVPAEETDEQIRAEERAMVEREGNG